MDLNIYDSISNWLSLQWHELSATLLLSWFASIGIIFGGVLPYIPQYRQIKRTENSDGFSTHVCFALLIANTLRILFWFGREFEAPLLVQSLVMNVAMLAMIELCVRVKQRHLPIVPNKNRYFLVETVSHLFYPTDNGNGSDTVTVILQPKRFYDFDFRYFWKWTDFISYIECMATFTVFTGLLMYMFVDVPVFVEVIGFLAVFIEAMLGAPQLLKNFYNKSTLGMSKMMVLGWTIGDVFKTAYFIIKRVPLQFWVCGVLQVSIDLFILGQVIAYRTQYKKLYNN